MIENFSFFLLKEFSHIAFSCSIEPLRIANDLLKKPVYTWSLMSENGVSEKCSNNSVTLVDSGMQPLSRNDRLLVISGTNAAKHTSPAILNYVRKCRKFGVRIGGMCTGSYVLAKAGLLDGKRCSVHWQYHELFQEIFPQVQVEKGVFVTDPETPTSAGGFASADLMLHLISQKHGVQLAAKVADQLVYAFGRVGAEKQGSLVASKNLALQRAIQLMEDHLEFLIPMSEIANTVGVSTRQLERQFKKYFKKSPMRYYKEIRLEKAHRILISSEMKAIEVGLACGFISHSNFSRNYRAMFGKSPHDENGLFLI